MEKVQCAFWRVQTIHEWVVEHQCARDLTLGEACFGAKITMQKMVTVYIKVKYLHLCICVSNCIAQDDAMEDHL